jgi:hypothetical protein
VEWTFEDGMLTLALAPLEQGEHDPGVRLVVEGVYELQASDDGTVPDGT